MMFTIPNVGVNQQSSLKGMASQKGENRHDLTAKRKKALKVKSQKIENTFVFSMYPLKLAKFYKKLNLHGLLYRTLVNKHSIDRVRTTANYSGPQIKKSAFKIFKQFLSTTKKRFFKHFAKRRLHSNKVLLHNKLWQKQFLRKFQKQFYPYLSRILSKFKRELAKHSHYTGYRQLVAKKNFLFSTTTPALLILLQRFFVGSSLNFCQYLLECGSCNVNGARVSNPWFFVPTYSIISFNFLPLNLIFLFLLTARFAKRRLKNVITKVKVKAHSPSALAEINFRTGELFFFGVGGSTAAPATFFSSRQPLDAMFLQWVFKKQKKFGLNG